jgi:uncharacterized membrane protein
MALDHARSFIHDAVTAYNPVDPFFTNIPVFLTRWVSHFCAPGFFLLAGISIYLIQKKKHGADISMFLLKRGLWLVIIELTVVNFAWRFDFGFEVFSLQVIWALGLSMICLSILVHMPWSINILFCSLIIFGHHLLDGFHYENSVLWSILHEKQAFYLPVSEASINISYPLIPWLGVMVAGYLIGHWYDRGVDEENRRKFLCRIGGALLVAFFVVRFANGYGNSRNWVSFDDWEKSFISFFAPLKYPPSLTFLFMTSGPLLLLLSFAEKIKGKFQNVLCVFGRVPFFFYVTHLYLIHIIALATGCFNDGKLTLLLNNVQRGGLLKVYLIWVLVLFILYPLCKYFGEYKFSHPEKQWLSYL